MTTLASPKIEDRRSHERSQLEAVIKEARRRQRRRWLAGGALVLAVAVGVGVGTTEFNGGRTGDNASAPSRPSSQRASARSGLSGLNVCGLLSTTDAAPILGSHVSGEAFTELGFPISPNTAPNPTYSQCRFTSTTSQSQMRLIINASPATAPPVSEEAIAARAQSGYRGTYDRPGPHGVGAVDATESSRTRRGPKFNRARLLRLGNPGLRSSPPGTRRRTFDADRAFEAGVRT